MARSRDGMELVEVRSLIDHIWDECAITGFVGRCWGRKHHSSFPGSNIVLCDGEDVVVIYQENANGNVKVINFPREGSKNILYKKVTKEIRHLMSQG